MTIRLSSKNLHRSSGYNNTTYQRKDTTGVGVMVGETNDLGELVLTSTKELNLIIF